MPGPRSKLTLASALRHTVDDLPGAVAVQYVCDGLNKWLEDPGLTWPAAIAGVAATAGIVNPVTVAGLAGLGVALGVTRFRRRQQDQENARQLEAALRRQAVEHESIHDILLALQDGSLTVGLDELALNDLREIVADVLQGQSEKLNDTLENLFNETLDDFPPGPLRDELDNLRILAADTNQIVRENAATLAELKQLILAQQPGDPSMAASPHDDQDTLLEAALLRVATDAERGDATARRALEDKSVREVGDYFTDRLAALDHAKQAVADRIRDEEVQLSREAAEVLYRTGRIDEAEQALKRILNYYFGDLSATNNLGRIAYLRGDLDAAQSRYRRVLELSKSDLTWQAVALGNLGTIAGTYGDFDQADKLFREVLDIYSRLGGLEGQANSLGNLGLIARTRGDLNSAEKLHRESFGIYCRLGQLEGQANQLGNLGAVAQVRGDLDAAEKLHRESLYIERELGRLEGQADDLNNLGLIARARGNLEDAKNLLDESLDLDRKLGRLEGQARTSANLGVIAKDRGEFDEARQRWVESRNFYEQMGIPHMARQLQGWLDGLDAEG